MGVVPSQPLCTSHHRRITSTDSTKTLQQSSVKSLQVWPRMPICHSMSSSRSCPATRPPVRTLHTAACVEVDSNRTHKRLGRLNPISTHPRPTAPALGLVAHAGARPRRPRAPAAGAPTPQHAPQAPADDGEAAGQAPPEPSDQPTPAIKHEPTEGDQERALQQAASDARAAQPTGDTLGTSDVQITVRGGSMPHVATSLFDPHLCCHDAWSHQHTFAPGPLFAQGPAARVPAHWAQLACVAQPAAAQRHLGGALLSMGCLCSEAVRQ